MIYVRNRVRRIWIPLTNRRKTHTSTTMKIKITTEVDIDVEQFFADCLENYEISAKRNKTEEKVYLQTTIYEIIRDGYIKQIEDNCYWKFEQKELYKDVKHHKLIDIEISKQILDNLKISPSQ